MVDRIIGNDGGGRGIGTVRNVGDADGDAVVRDLVGFDGEMSGIGSPGFDGGVVAGSWAEGATYHELAERVAANRDVGPADIHAVKSRVAEIAIGNGDVTAFRGDLEVFLPRCNRYVPVKLDLSYGDVRDGSWHPYDLLLSGVGAFQCWRIFSGPGNAFDGSVRAADGQRLAR